MLYMYDKLKLNTTNLRFEVTFSRNKAFSSNHSRFLEALASCVVIWLNRRSIWPPWRLFFSFARLPSPLTRKAVWSTCAWGLGLGLCVQQS